MMTNKLIAFGVFTLLAFSTSAQRTLKTITTLNSTDFKDTAAIYKAPGGKRYHISFVSDPYQKESAAIAQKISCGASNFAGVARARAKTSYVSGQAQAFNSISDIIKSLPTDNTMRKKLNANSARIAEEMKNVSLSLNVYLFAIKKESDNDYHLIIGDNKDVSKATFLNAEVSGLPARPDAKMQKVRDYVESHFIQVCGPSYAVFSQNPIPIKISGSVFYDVDHLPGEIGPVGLQPKTSWEIHPIASITSKE
jgi:hypothetical protein